MFRRALAAIILVAAGSYGASAAPTITQTGVLDFALSSAPNSFVLFDDAYSVTFPVAPQVTASDQGTAATTLHVAIAMADAGKEAYGFSVIPVPPKTPFDVQAGLNGSRDGFLKNVNGKLVSQDATTLSGLKGTHIVGSATVAGQPARLDLVQAWDPGHRALIGLYTLTLGAPAPQDHHCKLADGTFDGTKTHKQCDAAGGAWAKDVDYSGVIKTGVVAIGGETTGTTLDVAGSNEHYELDLHGDAALIKQAGNLSSKQVTVSGYLTTKKGVEIAERKIIVVTSIKN
jgi:hypothetical protein